MLADVAQEVEIADSSAVQSRLFTIVAALGPEKSRKGSTWAWIRSTHSATSLGRVERALGGRARVADQTGRPADERERAVAGQLQADAS